MRNLQPIDGIEGLQLLAVHTIVAMVFYFLPEGGGTDVAR